MAAPVLSFWDRFPPLAAIAVAKLGGNSIEIDAQVKGSKDDPATLTLDSGDVFSGPVLLQYLTFSGNAKELYPTDDPLISCQILQFLEYSQYVVNSSGLPEIVKSLDAHLALRTFLVGFSLTLADITIWGQLKGAAMWQKLKGSGNFPHLTRWFDFVSNYPEMQKVVNEWLAKKGPAKAPSGSAAKDGSKSGTDKNKDAGSYDIDLPNAEMGKVVTRFPPEPSGYLHIGHAKAALLNQHIANAYNGKMIVRFDDTNPSKEKDEFVENILHDIDSLGLQYDRLTYTSDSFQPLLEVAEKLIKAGKIYADDTPQEQMREERMEGIESKWRNRSVEETLKIWGEMQKGSEIGLANCMRYKMDMQALNKALRDPVVYRCNLIPHWRSGTKYKVYPTYDFACPFVDSVEGVTHALRTNEYKDREEQFQWILKDMQKVNSALPDVQIWEYSRLNFVYTLLSKRKLQQFVDTGRVDGWDDPRFPTVQGMLRRGLTLEALKEFIVSQGASKNTTLQEWDKIWAINKKIIDPIVPRHTAVESTKQVPLKLNGPDQPELVTVPRHKKNPDAGKKTTTRMSDCWLDQDDAQAVTSGEEITLMDWGNVIVKDIVKDADGTVTSISADLHLQGDFKKTKWKLTWLPQLNELVPLTLVYFDYLIIKPKLEEDDTDIEKYANPVTKTEKTASGDPNMRTLNKGDILQLERKGYFIVDKPYVRQGVPMVLFSIPDGRQKK